MSILKIFMPTLVHVLTNKRKYIEQSFDSVAGVMSQGEDLGVLGLKNLSVRICDGAPLTAHSSFGLSSPMADSKVLFGLILYIQVNNFLAKLGKSSWVEPVLSSGNSVLLTDTTQ